jgi:hypothetical protein
VTKVSDVAHYLLVFFSSKEKLYDGDHLIFGLT